MKHCKPNHLCHFLLVAILIFCHHSAHAAPRSVATVQTASAPLQVQRSGSAAAVALAQREPLFIGDVVNTGAVKATLLFDGGSQLRLNAGTIVELTPPQNVGGKTTLFRLIRGEVFAQLRPGLAATTNSATAAVRGTVFDLKVDENDVSTLVVVEGSVDFSNSFGGVAVGQSQQSVARPGQAPTAPVTVGNAGLIIEWTLDLNRAAVPREKFFITLNRGALAPELARRAQQAAAAPDDATAHRDYGDVLFDNGQYEAALAQYQEAERLSPNQTETLIRSGDALLELNRIEDAEARYRAALESAPESRAALVGLAWAALRRDAPDQAQTFAEQAIALLANDDAQTDLAAQVVLGLAQLRQGGKSDDAMKTFQDVLQNAPGELSDRYLYQARSWLAMANLAQSDQVAALREGEAAAQAAPNSALAHGNLALIYFFNNRPSEAVREARLATSLNPQSVAAQVALGQALLAQDDADAASRSAARAVALDPKSVQARYLLGVADASRRDYEHAARELNAALQLAPEFLPAASTLARVYTRMGRNDEAIQLLENLLPDAKNSDAVLAALGETLYEQGKYLQAIENYQKARTQNPGSALYAGGLARVLIDANRLSDAIIAAQDAVRLAPTVGQYHAILGLAYDFSNVSSQSEREYRAAIAYDPQNALARARIALRANDPGATIDTFTQAFLYDPAVSTQLLRGGISTELGGNLGTDSTRGINALHRDIFADGKGHGIAGLGISRDGGNSDVPNGDSSGSTFRGDLTYVPSPPTTIYANIVRARAKQGLSGFDSPFGFDSSSDTSFGFNQLLLAGKRRLGRGNSLWLGLTYQTLRNDLSRSTNPTFLPFPLPFGTPFPYAGQNFDNSALIPEVRADFALNREPTRAGTLTLGLARASLNPDLVTSARALVDVNGGPTTSLPPLFSNGDQTFSVAYAQLTQRFNDKFSLVAQLRAQRDKVTTRTLGNAGNQTVVTNSTESNLLPGVVASYQADRRTTLRFLLNSNAGTTNLALAPNETRLTLEPGILSRGVPRKSRIFELDAEHRFDNNSFLKLFLFHANADDVAFGSDAPVFAFRITPPLFADRVTQTGIGVRYEQPLGRHFYGQASLLLNRTESRAAGQVFDNDQAPYYPNSLASIGLNYIDPQGNKATILANNFGSIFADRPNFFGIPSATTRPFFGSQTYFSILLSREPTVHNEFTIGVTNIFDAPAITFNSVPVISDNFGTGRRRFFASYTRRF